MFKTWWSIAAVAACCACGQPSSPSNIDPTASPENAPAESAAPAKSAEAPPTFSSPVRASGTMQGKAFQFECGVLEPAVSVHEKSSACSAEQAGTLDLWIHCLDGQAKMQANLHLKNPAVGDTTPVAMDESAGRIAIVSASPQEVITTQDTGRGKITVSGWDAASKHVKGFATLAWAKDSSGKPGSLRMDFDLAIPTCKR